MACKMSNSSAETVAGNDDLLTEGILLRLPAKSLVRFQSVCKHWRSLILSPSFCRVHTRRSIHSGGGGGDFIFTPFESDVIHFNPVTKAIHKFQIPQTSHVKILQSSNGLWLLELDGGKNYSVHNPTTKQSKVLELSRPKNFDGPCATSLWFDPSISIHYKALFIYSEDKQSRFCVETFDSETDEWTSAYYPSELGFRKPELYDWIFLNNKLYSMSWSTFQISYLLDPQTGNVVRVPKINLTGDKPGVAVDYSSIEYPCFYNYKGSNGRLHCALSAEYYFDDDMHNSKRYLSLFELAEDNSGWLQLCNVDIHRILGVDIGKLRVRVMRCADQREGHVLLHVEVGMFISYRFCDGKSELALDPKALLRENLPGDLMWIMLSPFCGLHRIFPFRQTLAPV